MSKPLGLTGSYRLVVPTATEDRVWEAVREAIAAGWTVEQFRRECAQAWTGSLEEDARRAAEEWERR